MEKGRAVDVFHATVWTDRLIGCMYFSVELWRPVMLLHTSVCQLLMAALPLQCFRANMLSHFELERGKSASKAMASHLDSLASSVALAYYEHTFSLSPSPSALECTHFCTNHGSLGHSRVPIKLMDDLSDGKMNASLEGNWMPRWRLMTIKRWPHELINDTCRF